MQEQQPVWVHPGRITGIEPSSGRGYRVTIDSTKVTASVRDLDEQKVIGDLSLSASISNLDTDEIQYTLEMESLPDQVRMGRPVMVEVNEDEDDGPVIRLHPGALYQELNLPGVLYLVCPVENQGRWFRQTHDDSVYECSCGSTWDVFPEDGEDADEI